MNYTGLVEDYKEYFLQGMQNEQRLQKSSIETLPTGVLSKIFSCLGKDLQQVTPVNGLLCRVAINTAKHEKFSAMKSFVDFIYTCLGDSHADQKKQLLDVVNGTKILDSVNLIQVKSSMDGMKESILNVLKNLSVTTLDELEALSKNETIPLFFEDVFFLARIYKQVDEANAMDDPRDQSLDLVLILGDLLRQGKIEKAIEIADTIPMDPSKSCAPAMIVETLLKTSQTERAIEIAGKIPGEYYKSFALDMIVVDLLEKGKIEEATKIADTIPLEKEKLLAFRKIADFKGQQS